MGANTVIECSLTGSTRYTMNDLVYDGLRRAFKLRLFRTVKSFVSALPDDLKKTVKVGKFKPHPKPEVRGHRPSFVFYDELATPEEIKRAIDYAQSKV